MEQEKPKKDVVEFLKGGETFFVKTFNWPEQLSNRAFAFLAVKKGIFSFKEFFQFLLPVSLCPAKKGLVARFERFIAQEIKEEVSSSVYCDGWINLFGKKFGDPDPLAIREIMELIKQIVINDQYHAKPFLKEDTVVVDAGANIGTFSVFATNLAPKIHVYAFEPVDGTFQVLKENTKYYPDIVCVPFGLGDEVSSKNIFVSKDGRGGSVLEDSLYNGNRQSKTKEEVKITTIDVFVAEKNLSRVDFIKIDTEGYEAKILRGARETIKKYKPVIAMSAYHNPNDKEDLPRMVKEISLDYVCELHKDSEEDLVCYPKK